MIQDFIPRRVGGEDHAPVSRVFVEQPVQHRGLRFDGGHAGRDVVQILQMRPMEQFRDIRVRLVFVKPGEGLLVALGIQHEPECAPADHCVLQ